MYTNKTLSGRKRREIPSGLQLDDFQSVNDEVKGVKAEDFFLLVIESLYENREREEWRKIHMPNWDAMLRESQGQQKSTYSPGNSSTTELISTTTETKIESEDLLKRVKRGPCDPCKCD